jgi:uncharacterized surface anchored protein
MVKEIVLLAAGEAIPDDFGRLWKEKMISCNERKVSGNNGGKNTVEKQTAEKTELQRTNSMGSGTNEADKKSNESTKTDSQCSRVLEKDKVNQTDPVVEPIMPSSTSQKKRKTSKHGLQMATKTARISSPFSSAKEASGSEEDLHRSV